MKNIFKLSLILLLFCSSALKAESSFNYIPGFVIQSNGDTLKGTLLIQKSKNAGEKCVFKTGTGENKTFLPGEIQGYRYEDGKYYISKEIQKDSLNKKTVFLEYLIKGITSIYYSFDETEHYYAEKDGIGLMELTEDRKIKAIDNVNYIAYTQTKGKLMYLMGDCPDVKNDITHINIDHKSLIKLAKTYHEKVCDSKSCIIYEKANKPIKLSWNPFIGYSKNQYDFGGIAYTYFMDNLQIGMGLKFSNIFKFDEHLNLRVNLILEKDSKYSTLTIYKGMSNVNVESDGESYSLTTYEAFPTPPTLKVSIDVLDINIPITLNKEIPLSKESTLFFGAGLANKFIISQNPNFKLKKFYESHGSIRSYFAGIAVNIGLEEKLFGNHTFTINASYEHLQNWGSEPFTSLHLFNNQFSIQLGVFL
jgi:hypothetical protein